ncbi:ABC transporter substrate-binding protein [Cupriavidus sp. 30B13]|uniref:ABC transporter substrate-binding protein n=1 Tax=Cupriavidus sp. 30B13 TaxID=3384241 RepID=UPI003CF67708
MKLKRRDVLKIVGAGAAVAGSGTLLGGVARAQSKDPLKIGFISSLTGAQAPIGQPMLLGAQIAVDQVNQAGGVNGRKLELVIRDDKAKPADATVAARELAGSGVNLQMGVVSSAVALALTAMLEQEKAVLITCAAHSDKLTKENFSRNYFRVTDNPYMKLRFMARALAERYGAVSRWSGLVPDHEYGRTTWNCFEEGLLEYYPSVAKKEPSISQALKTQYGATDYRNVIGSAMGLPADGFFVSVYGGDAVTLFKQAQPYGFFRKAKVVVDPANEFVVAKAMKRELPEMWCGSHWYAGAFEDLPLSNAVLKEHVRRTNDPYPTGWVGEGHAAVMAYVKAIQEAGGTGTQAIVKALEGVTFDTVCGPRHFRREDHQAIKPLIMYRLRGSRTAAAGFEVLEYIKMPGQDFVDPPTPGKPLSFRYVKA